MFINLLIILSCIFLMMLPGFFSARTGLIGEKSLREISAVHIRFIYPCLIISSMTSSFDLSELRALWFLPAGCFGIMLAGYLIALAFMRLPVFDSGEERRAFQFQCTINNYSFIPIPIAMSLCGSRGAAAVIYASIGAETALWTLGIASLKGFSLDRKILGNFLAPPLLALYFSLALIMLSGCLSFDLKEFLSSHVFFSKMMLSVKSLGTATIPLAMVVCGARMALMPMKEINKRSVWLATVLRLLVIPAIAIFAIRALPIAAEYRNVLFIIAAMPTAVASILLSEIYGGDKDFMTASVLVTHAASLASVPLMLSLAHWL